MTQNVTPPDDDDTTNARFPTDDEADRQQTGGVGINHPTVTVDDSHPSPFDTTGEVHFPDDERPDYDIIAATDPRTEFDGLEQTRMGRLELTDRDELDEFDHATVFDAIGAARDQFHDQFGETDCLIERVYVRDYADEKTLCAHIRAPARANRERSHLLLAIDEQLRDAFFGE